MAWYNKGFKASDRYSYKFRKWIRGKWSIDRGWSFPSDKYFPNGPHASYTTTEQQALDEFHCWSVFMMHWPGIAFYSLVGRE